MRERLDPRSAGRQNIAGDQQGGGGVADGEPGDAERHLLHGLQVVGDAVAGDLGGADQRGLDLGCRAKYPATTCIASMSPAQAHVTSKAMAGWRPGGPRPPRPWPARTRRGRSRRRPPDRCRRRDAVLGEAGAAAAREAITPGDEFSSPRSSGPGCCIGRTPADAGFDHRPLVGRATEAFTQTRKGFFVVDGDFRQDCRRPREVQLGEHQHPGRGH